MLGSTLPNRSSTGCQTPTQYKNNTQLSQIGRLLAVRHEPNTKSIHNSPNIGLNFYNGGFNSSKQVVCWLLDTNPIQKQYTTLPSRSSAGCQTRTQYKVNTQLSQHRTKFLQCWVQLFQIGRLLAVRHEPNTKTIHNSPKQVVCWLLDHEPNTKSIHNSSNIGLNFYNVGLNLPYLETNPIQSQCTCLMVFNDTFNDITVTGISLRSVILVEETGVPGENHRPVASQSQYTTRPQNWKEIGTTTNDLHLKYTTTCNDS